MTTTQFAATYVTANLGEDASAFDISRFLSLKSKLDVVRPSSHEGYTIGVLSAILCAQRRGDAVPALFRAATQDATQEMVKMTFITVRECITLINPYVGIPSCMPAIIGLVGELRHRGIDSVPSPKRPGFDKCDWNAEGDRMRETLYGGVGNQEGLAFISNHWPDFAHYAYTAVFGYLYGSRLLSTRESELIVASAILGQGATRQARIHCKVALKLGNAIEILKEVVDAAVVVGIWNNSPLPVTVDVEECAEQLKDSLSKRGMP
ncbi:hypothetical protein BDW67DRAFT_186388 [Aspergillus spinulosporus]